MRYESQLLIGVSVSLVSMVSSLASWMVLPAIAVEGRPEDSSLDEAADTVSAGASVPENEDLALVPLSISAASIPQPQNDAAQNLIGQVTSVTQLSDVQPDDWAFESLQFLVERYNCLEGYPDGTYRGQNAISRYEFAAGLSACLDQVASSFSGQTTPEDLATLQRLQQEFASELASLQDRADVLEFQVSELQDNQFSTTTQLNGEVIFSLAGATGGYPGAGDSDATPAFLSNTGGRPGDDAQVVFNNRVRLNLVTSFTGRDALITGLQANNFGGGFGQSGSIPGTLGLGDPVFGTGSNASLGYAPQFGRTVPDTLSNSAANSVQLYKLLYLFPVSQNFSLFVAPRAETSDAFPAVSPFASDSQGAISRFAGYNAAYRVSGGTSGVGLATVFGFVWNISDAIDWRAFYGSTQASVPVNGGLTGGAPLGAGLFNGSNVIATQLTLRPSDTFNIGLNYASSYHQINILATGLTSADIGSVIFSPSSSQLAAVGGNRTLAVLNEGIRMNSLGGTATWQFSPQVAVTASGAYIFSDLVDVNASTNFVSWLVGLHFQDLLAEGNTAGLIFGQPLNRDTAGGGAINPENADPYQVEGYLTVRLSDNITLTPGAFVIFNPEGYSGNDTTVVGALRTTFTF